MINNKSSFFKILFLSSITPLIYIIGNYLWISIGHFDEDAYILFRYVEMAIKGNGIVFYPGGGHTEGATDFLWMVLLIILGKLGLNVGWSSILLNGIGVLIINLFFFQTILKKTKNELSLLLIFPIAVCWILFFPLIAALGGFSVLLYCAIVIGVLYWLYTEERILLLPYLSLCLGLFRPDGLIIGLCASIIGFFISYRKQIIKKYNIHILIAFSFALIYFIWRVNYFEDWFPLPIYVKSQGNAIFQFISNINSYKLYKQMLILLMITILLLFINRKDYHLYYVLIPIFFHVSAFTFMHQSQNIGFRFQAPFIIGLYYILLIISVNFTIKYDYKIIMVILPILMLFTSIKTYRYFYYSSVVREYPFAYINQFTYLLSKDILKGDEKLGITEAGRFAFWDNKKNEIVDLVGLNNKYYAKNNISQKDLEKENITIFMVYWKGNNEISNIENTKNNIYRIKTIYEYKEIFKNYLIPINTSLLSKDNAATNTAILFLKDHFQEYDVILVDEARNGNYNHIYAIKKKNKITEPILNLLEQSFMKENQKSYNDLILMNK